MLVHGEEEMARLRRRCWTEGVYAINGWCVDRWELDDDDVEEIARLYDAVLLADVDAEMAALVAGEGVSLGEILLDRDGARDEITRADAVELAAAASLLEIDQWPIETLHMPNVPKMSRRKSDSGVDVMAVQLSIGEDDNIVPGDTLYLASVKHSIDAGARGLRYKLVKSLTAELSTVYVGTQLRVLHGELRKQGFEPARAKRIYRFLAYLDDDRHVVLHGVAAVDPTSEESLNTDLRLLPSVSRQLNVRILCIPSLSTLHARCS